MHSDSTEPNERNIRNGFYQANNQLVSITATNEIEMVSIHMSNVKRNRTHAELSMEPQHALNISI